MGLKEDIYNGLIGHGVYKVDVDREATINGLPSVAVVVHAADGRDPHAFTFAKVNHMDTDSMVAVIRSYLRNRT